VTAAGASSEASGARVSRAGAVPAEGRSALALETLRLAPGGSAAVGDGDADTLLFVFAGDGLLAFGGGRELVAGTAALLCAGERGALTAGERGLEAVRVTVGPDVDVHAPLGARETVVAIERADVGSATGKRSFQVLFGPHNGSTRATLFAGYVPPGAAPWHYHLYDEIVWIRRGEGRLHLRGGVEAFGPGSAFRLSPREAHVVENTGQEELAVLGAFTPAGSPSAAYLAEPADAAAYLLDAS